MPKGRARQCMGDRRAHECRIYVASPCTSCSPFGCCKFSQRTCSSDHFPPNFLRISLTCGLHLSLVLIKRQILCYLLRGFVYHAIVVAEVKLNFCGSSPDESTYISLGQKWTDVDVPTLCAACAVFPERACSLSRALTFYFVLGLMSSMKFRALVPLLGRSQVSNGSAL